VSASIRATCKACDTAIELPSAKFIIAADQASYEFVCPACKVRNFCEADRNIIELLIEGGVPIRRPRSHPEKPPPGAVITEDDLIAFGLAIEGLDDLASQA